MANKEIILVVDDEVGPRESLRMILQPRYEVHMASGGQEALGFITNKYVDVVTLDLNMPGVSGIDVLKGIRDLQPNTEVIVITGYGTLDNAQEAFRLGVGNFIPKPFTATEVLSIISNSLERRAYESKIRSLAGHIHGLRCAFSGGYSRDKNFSTNFLEWNLWLPSSKNFMNN